MSYNQPFRPQIYSYQSRSRFRQYPRQVVTSIPGAGFAVDRLQWGDQAIDLSGLGLGPSQQFSDIRWWEATPAFWAKAAPLGFDDYPQRSEVPRDRPVYLGLLTTPQGNSLVAMWEGGPEYGSLSMTAPDKVARVAQVFASLERAIPSLSTAEAYNLIHPPNHTASYIGLGLGIGAVVLLGGGGYYLWKRGKKAV